MSNKVKGTDIQGLRRIFKRRGPEKEDQLIARLSPKLSQLYLHSLPVSWNAIEDQLELYEHAAQVLFPGDAAALRKLGREMALETFTGIYKIFLSIPTLSFVVNQAAMIWKQYYDTGQAAVETLKNGNRTEKVVFIVTGFPDLPANLRETIGGYLMVLADLTGEKNAALTIIDRDPQAWRWEFDLTA